MNFGDALLKIKDGYSVMRSGWNGKKMYIFLHRPEVDSKYNGFEISPHIVMKTADDKIQNGWLASQTDMLAEDWMIAEKTNPMYFIPADDALQFLVSKLDLGSNKSKLKMLAAQFEDHFKDKVIDLTKKQ